MKALILFEQSGTVRDAFAAIGCYSLSVDRDPCRLPGNHIQAEVFAVLPDLIREHWDIVIAHPSCTYLTNSAAWAFGDGPYHQKVRNETLVGAARREARELALRDVEILWNTPFKRLVIENPSGCINTRIPHMPRPQWIHPHQFGHDASKMTGLWKRGLPDIMPTDIIAPRIVSGRPRWANQTDSGQNRLSPGIDRWLKRSITYPGIASAFALQWTSYIKENKQ